MGSDISARAMCVGPMRHDAPDVQLEETAQPLLEIIEKEGRNTSLQLTTGSFGGGEINFDTPPRSVLLAYELPFASSTPDLNIYPRAAQKYPGNGSITM